MGGHPVQPLGHGLRGGVGDEAGFAVGDDLGGLAGVGGGQHRLGGQEGFPGDHAEVLVDRRENRGEGAGVNFLELLLGNVAEELDAGVALGHFAQFVLVGAGAGDEQRQVGLAGAHGADDQVEALPLVQAADGEKVLALARGGGR